VDGWRTSGEHLVEFGQNGLSSGVYVYSLQAGSAIESKRMLLLR
jgi:hypothetical protein